MNHQQELINEITFQELWKIILKRKLPIFIITILTTAVAFAYAWTSIPIYQGTMLIEVGEVIFNSDPNNDKPILIEPLEKTSDLIEVLNQKFKLNNPEGASINIVSDNKESTLIRVISENSTRKAILQDLNKIANTVLKRHQIKGNYFEKVHGAVRPTSVNPSIKITPDPIRPNKKFILILGLIGGLVVSLFFVFLLEFLPFNARK